MMRGAYALIEADFRPFRKATAVPRIAIVSSSYHVLRTLIVARTLKIPCIGFGCRTRLYVSMNAFVREYLLYMRLTRKRQLTLLAVFTVVYWTAGLILNLVMK